jgi:tRNA-dihydrouridine synthase A
MDGVMVGREAYQNPGMLLNVDRELFGSDAPLRTAPEVIRSMYPYIEAELAKGTYLGHMTRHILGIFQSVPGARQWRRHLSENAHKPGSGIEVVEQALQLVTQPHAALSQA